MTPLPPGHPTRERIRRNVGRLTRGPELWPGLPVPGRFGLVFQGGELLGGAPDNVLAGAIPAPAVAPELASGRTIHLNMVVTTGTREIAVSGSLPVPSVIRQITVFGSNAVNDAISFRVLVSDDADTTATAEPTGSDLIEYGGDLVGAEDPGAHAILGVAPLVFEPWRRILTAGLRLKLKVHNVAGANRTVGLYADIDDLVNV